MFGLIVPGRAAITAGEVVNENQIVYTLGADIMNQGVTHCVIFMTGQKASALTESENGF